MNREQFDAALRAHALTEPQVQPHAFDSPIEFNLAYSLHKVLDFRATLARQVELPTRGGLFRGDLVLACGGLNTLIECDGEAYHLDVVADEFRSALILDTGLIDQVIRLDGRLLTHAPNDGAYLVGLVHPAAIALHPQLPVARRASPEVRAQVAAGQVTVDGFQLRFEAAAEDDRYGPRHYGAEDEYVGPLREFKARYASRSVRQGAVARMRRFLAAQPAGRLRAGLLDQFLREDCLRLWDEGRLSPPEVITERVLLDRQPQVSDGGFVSIGEIADEILAEMGL